MKRTETDPMPDTPRNFRIRSGQTGRAVADRMGVTPGAYSRLERQRPNPNRITLGNFFQAVDRDDLSDLFVNGNRPGTAAVSFRDLREAAGLNVSETAALMGDPASQVSRVEVGESHTTAAVLGRYFAAVGRQDLASVCLAVTDHVGSSTIRDVMRQPGIRVQVAGPGLNSGSCMGPLIPPGDPVPQGLVRVPGQSRGRSGVARFLSEQCLLSDTSDGVAVAGLWTGRRALAFRFNEWAKRNGVAELGERAFLGAVSREDGVLTVRNPSNGARVFNVVVNRAAPTEL